MNIDPIDRHILDQLQQDATISLDALGETVGLSRNACWRRIKNLEENGIIEGRVTLLSPQKLGLALTVFIAIKTDHHSEEWLANFARITKGLPEIQGVFRTSGDMDYLIRAVVSDISDYDRLYKHLIAKVDFADVSASFVMEEVKHTTALPL